MSARRSAIAGLFRSVLLLARRPRLLVGLLVLTSIPSPTPAAVIFPGNFPVDGDADKMVMADFNHDGINDMAVSSVVAFNTVVVSVHLGEADGRFRQTASIPDLDPFEMHTGDLNGDGLLDLVLVDITTGSEFDVLLLPGNGDGTFQPPKPLVHLPSYQHVAVGDFDGDHLADVAIADLPHSRLRILRSAASGTPPPEIDINLAYPASWVTAGDLNHDGMADLVASASSYVGILLATGGGQFAAATWITDGFGPGAAVIADLTGDGLPDIAVPNFGSDNLLIMSGTGGGQVTPGVFVGVGRMPVALAAGDLDSDGRQDLAVVNQSNNPGVFNFGTVWMVRSDAAGNFSGQELFTQLNGAPSQIAVGDLNNDGHADLAIGIGGPGRIWLEFGDGHAGFAAFPAYPSGTAPFAIATADFDEDGELDVVTASLDSGILSFRRGHGDGTFGDEVQIPTGTQAWAIATADFDGDGHADLALIDAATGNLLRMYGDGHLGFQTVIDASLAGRYPGSLVVGDFDLDHRPDIAVTTAFGPALTNPYQEGGLAVLLNLGGRTFQRPLMYNAGLEPLQVLSEDVNKDGVPDLLVLDHGVGSTSGGIGEAVLVFPGLGDGSLGTRRAGWFQPCCSSSTSPYAMALGDFDLDGNADLAISFFDSSVPESVQYLFGDGTGAFHGFMFQPAGVSVGRSPRSLVSADFNGDGIADVLTSNFGSSDLSFVPGLGVRPDIVFGPPNHEVRYQSGQCPQAMAVADFNHDHRPDVAVADFCSKDVAILLNINPAPDHDRDGVPDADDPCTDVDRDGYGDPGYPANTCSPDNCPAVANPDQADADRDGVGDACDDCPATYDPAQKDDDHDGIGDACDTCIDTDRDGFGFPGVPGGACPPDNCPYRKNPDQSDVDGDGVGDACDTCNDPDHDGYASSLTLATLCPLDNCPQVSNPGQQDSDGDMIGDACDACPLDALNDLDHDGVCGNLDNCPFTSNSDQADRDNDGIGDVCDNCPGAANPGQEDSNHDGAGDACQPSIGVIEVQPVDGNTLEASIPAIDPQNDPLSGTLTFTGSHAVVLHSIDVNAPRCDQGYFPQGIPGEGIGYLYAPDLTPPVLFDIDGTLSDFFGVVCEDGIADYWFWSGPCGPNNYAYGETVQASPGAYCLRKANDHDLSKGTNFAVSGQPGESITLNIGPSGPDLVVPFTGGLPREVDISGLSPDTDYKMVVEVTDGNTPPVKGAATFQHHNEGRLVILSDRGPRAVASAQGTECTSASGGSVLLDGSGSSDPDSTPGTNDDIASFDWYEDYGLATQHSLGSGESFSVTLPLGLHAITLKVTDKAGQSSAASTSVSVIDTTPPVVDCTMTVPSAECQGAGGAYVSVTATAHDTCGGVTLTNTRTPNGGDASGPYLLGTTNVAFTATDAAGHQATCTSAVTVRDTQPPTLSLQTDPTTLWPPNHEMVPVHVSWVALDLCDGSAAVQLVSVTSSEPDDAPGNDDGATMGDIQGAVPSTADADLSLRAERDGKGSGRVYTLTYRAVDRSGNATPGIATVTVPHDQGHGPEPLLMQLAPATTGAKNVRIIWPSVDGATEYDVIAGDLSAWHVANGVLDLGAVQVLAQGTTVTSVTEPPASSAPAVGHGIFYLIQQRTGASAAGYGTESAPWPRVPGSCEGGCPTATTQMAGAGAGPSPRR